MRRERVAAIAGSALSRADQLILEAATGARRLSRQELQEVLEHVAQAGFDPNARERARGELAGVTWRGQVLQGSSMLLPAERHYVKHVLVRQEWPEGTTLNDYLESIRAVILDPSSGVAVGRYLGTSWQLTVVRRSGQLRGLKGRDWILVDYRIETGHWVTAYQFALDPRQQVAQERSDVRWLRLWR
jgi:hypothetical protein